MAEKKAQEYINSTREKVQSDIGSGNGAGALKAICSEIPATKEEEFKTKHAETAAMALNSITQSKIKDTLSDFDEDEKTTLMKYVYKAMSLGQNCPNLLSWHAALVENCGIGIISRAMCDRKL